MSNSVNMDFDFAGIINGIEKMEKNIDVVEKKATQKAGKVIAEKLKANTPRSDITASGYKHLQDNIKISSLKEDENLDKYRGVGFGKSQYKADWLEFGTSKMQGTNFITNTMQETKSDVKNVINEVLKKELNL